MKTCKPLVLVLLLLLPDPAAIAQQVRSRKVEMDISNRVDTLPPGIVLLSPRTENDSVFSEGEPEIRLIGKVSDDHDIRFFAVNGNLLSLTGEGGFDCILDLYPGRNEIRLVATDTYGNLTERFVIVEYRQATISPSMPKTRNP